LLRRSLLDTEYGPFLTNVSPPKDVDADAIASKQCETTTPTGLLRLGSDCREPMTMRFTSLSTFI
jgi:hypothetical protein